MLNPEHYRIRRLPSARNYYRDAVEARIRAWCGQWMNPATFVTPLRWAWTNSRNVQPMSPAWERVPPFVELTLPEVAELTGQSVSCLLMWVTYCDPDTGKYDAKIKGLPLDFQILYRESTNANNP